MTENLAFQQHLFSEPLFIGVLEDSKMPWILESGSALFLGNALCVIK